MMGEKVEAEPQEKEDVMISPTLLVIMIKHGCLSPRGRLYRVGLVQRGCLGCTGQEQDEHRCPSKD